MCESGWNVNAYCFYQKPLTAEIAIRNTKRKKGLLKCEDLIGLNEFIGIDMDLRSKHVEKAYMSLPYSEFEH